MPGISVDDREERRIGCAGAGNLRKPEKIKAERVASECNYASECVHIRQKKFGVQFRYSARTRVVIEEKSVRIVQRMKNLAARKTRGQVTGHRQQEPETKTNNPQVR